MVRIRSGSQLDVLGVVAVGGALGSLGRYGLSEAIPRPADGFPWATFIANVSGCFAIGVLMAFMSRIDHPPRHLRPFVGIGILGGFTTFSTYAVETRQLIAEDATALAVAYAVGSVAFGLLAVQFGLEVTRLTIRRRGAERQ